ncbi:MAG: PSD1 domain-containing protein [Bryobacterales bacterium]|nr:PSD1 domain-containing protein [Bryobacterales bacterium]
MLDTSMRLVVVLFAMGLLAHAEPVSYARQVRPVLAERCLVCHSERNPAGKLSLGSVAAMAKGGVSGPALVAGSPERSLLVQSLKGDKPRMPKSGAALSGQQVALLERWIAEGAKDDAAGAAPEVWWSLKPLRKPAVPGAGHPVDAFLRQRLSEAGLAASPEAGRRTLIRRLYLDLHGLPPSLEEIEAFVADRSPRAYEDLVDRLLASPRYGERWARHWLDVIHYGESHGYDKDKPRRNAWPYRDWAIEALNSDKPYAEFIREQVAGDVLYPANPKAYVATGFLAAGPWDFVGHQELKEGLTDKDNTRSLDRDDVVATVVSSFSSMTAHCARCHDHKFDPIPQQDYYNLQAVFAGVDRAETPFDDDPTVHQKRQGLLRAKRDIQLRLQPYLDKVELASTPEIVKLDSSIQDAGLLIVHMGEPKTDADRAKKKMLEERRVEDRKRRQELVDAIVGPETYAAIERIKAEFVPVDAELAKLPKPRLVYRATGFFTRMGNFRPPLEPRPVTVLARGNVRSPLGPASPGALTCVSGVNAKFTASSEEGQRRAALANWIADGRNVLTWRSVVNRVWHYHFGAGIVDTPSDFGRMGSKPTHPELLDWMAAWFRDEAGGSMKQLHRLLVTSAAYRQSSKNREDGARVDADNRLLWRMNRGRLEAESVRDAMLAIAGKLDLTIGGPSVEMFFFKDDHSPVYDYARFDPDAAGAYRRSIYRFLVRSVPDPFMERLDCPDPSVLTAKRSTTITAIQALALLNNPFVLRMAEHFAERAGTAEQAVKLAFGREATAAERELYGAYAATHGMVNLCRLLFNTNEFLFVD